MEIGHNTCIGGNTKILDNDFHPIEYEKRNALLQGSAPEGDDSRAEWIGKANIAYITRGLTYDQKSMVRST